MEEIYKSKLNQLGYTQLVCNIFPNWENVKDEILVPERKSGSGNGTIHIFLGAADNELQKEFSSYYSAVKNGEDPSVGAIKIKHYFLVSNVLSMIGHICQYYYAKGESSNEQVRTILSLLSSFPIVNGMLETTSLFKLSIGSSRLRPYFKQFDSNGVFTKLIRLLLLPNTGYKISLYKNANGDYSAFWLIGFDWQTDFEADSNKSHLINNNSIDKNNLSLQQIYYGAPGTGKSFEIKKQTAGKHVIRTTFHPDSDYSTFVGAYKPVMEEVDARVVPVVFNNSGIGFDKNNGTFKENRIVYKFVKQAFLKAYLGAWKKFANSQYNNTTTPPSSFNIPGAGYYTISGVEPKNIILSRIFDFSKKTVSDEWPNLWKNGTFEVPSGAQSGKSVQHAIAIWINKHIPSCTVEDFEKGWVKLISHIKELGTVDVVKKTQTYILSLSEDKEDLLSVTVEAAKKSRNNLLKIYEGKNTSYRLDNTLVSILKKYDDKSFKEAWDKLAKDVKSGTQVGKIDVPNDELEPQFLIIEEINRGNCAQIFGDLFQLLDRSENGYSTYPIEADSDIQDVIKKAFEDDDEYKLDFLDINGAIDDYTSNYGSNLSEDVKQGRVLLLPPNLYIWATMNTSDQSLFPIDSAFKRRWEWKYIKIKKGKDKNGNDLDWKIDVKMDENGALLSWWNFIEKINTIIASMTSSADKQLGFFFCQANADGIITTETFVSKVIFYLWNDVFKDYGFEDASLFRYTDKDGKEYDLTFPDFYDEDGEKINTERLTDFLKKVMSWKKNNEESN